MTEHELRALAPFVDLPDERELAPAVRARLRGRPQRRRTVLVVVAAALAAVAVAFAVPPARSAILRLFHLQGARIELRRPAARRPDRTPRPRRPDRARRTPGAPPASGRSPPTCSAGRTR